MFHQYFTYAQYLFIICMEICSINSCERSYAYSNKKASTNQHYEECNQQLKQLNQTFKMIKINIDSIYSRLGEVSQKQVLINAKLNSKKQQDTKKTQTISLKPDEQNTYIQSLPIIDAVELIQKPHYEQPKPSKTTTLLTKETTTSTKETSYTPFNHSMYLPDGYKIDVPSTKRDETIAPSPTTSYDTILPYDSTQMYTFLAPVPNIDDKLFEKDPLDYKSDYSNVYR